MRLFKRKRGIPAAEYSILDEVRALIDGDAPLPHLAIYKANIISANTTGDTSFTVTW